MQEACPDTTSHHLLLIVCTVLEKIFGNGNGKRSSFQTFRFLKRKKTKQIESVFAVNRKATEIKYSTFFCRLSVKFNANIEGVKMAAYYFVTKQLFHPKINATYVFILSQRLNR